MAIIGQNVADWFRGQPYVSGVALAVFLTGPLFLAASIPTWVALSVFAVVAVSLTWLACQCYRIFSAREERTTPIERLGHRYANGEIDDAEFEARLVRLLSLTDDPRADRLTAESVGESGLDSENEYPKSERERELEYEVAVN